MVSIWSFAAVSPRCSAADTHPPHSPDAPKTAVVGVKTVKSVRTVKTGGDDGGGRAWREEPRKEFGVNSERNGGKRQRFAAEDTARPRLADSAFDSASLRSG